MIRENINRIITVENRIGYYAIVQFKSKLQFKKTNTNLLNVYAWASTKSG